MEEIAVDSPVWRLVHALDSLVRTEIPIAEISVDLGFSSQSAFTRFFAANVGLAPTEYRRAAKVLRA